MNVRRDSFDAIESQAAAWLTRRDGGMSSEENAEFEAWRAADPRHAAAVTEIESVWNAFDRPAASGSADILRGELNRLVRRDRRRWQTAVAAGGLAAAACLAVVFWPQRVAVIDSVPAAAAPPTARVSEPEIQTLPDGSLVELKPGAAIEVAFNTDVRLIVLKQGEAHFAVVPNPDKPFLVEAGSVRVRAVGTAFSVQLGGTEVEVVVTEGKVSVTSPAAIASTTIVGDANPPVAEAPVIAVGQRAVVALGETAPTAAVTTLAATELSERLAWRVPRLDFSETSLGEAAALFTRHGATGLRVADSTVGAMRVTGVFRADNVEGFVRALESSLGLQAERRGSEIVLRARK